MKSAIAVAVLALLTAACEGEDGTAGRPPQPDTDSKPLTVSMDPQAWTIGPVINGRNYSIGMEASPKAHPEGWSVLVQQGTSPHYLTTRSPSLAGYSAIRISFRVEGAPLIGVDCGPLAGTASAYFQSKNDDWRMDGERWWATFATATLERLGEYQIVAPLDGPWTSVESMSAVSDPARFASAKANAAQIGLTLGNCRGHGHGVTVAGQDPARLVVTGFALE